MKVNYFSAEQSCFMYEEEECEYQIKLGDNIELFSKSFTVVAIGYLPQVKVLVVYLSK